MEKCIRCQKSYSVENSDLEFYKKLAVTAPTHCPTCRVIRRMAWRNDRNFYTRKCSLSSKQMISIYPAGTTFPVYHPEEWYSDLWDPKSFALEYNPNIPFFKQWEKLFNVVPRLGVDLVNCENSDYCNYCGDNKNCYLDIAGEGNEDCYYNLFTKHSKNCVDCTFVYNSSYCYQSINSHNCYEVINSQNLRNSNNCLFSVDLKSCNNCIFSYNLRNESYRIFNKPVSREKYKEFVEKLNLQTYTGYQKALQIYLKDVRSNAYFRAQTKENSENCLGDDINNSSNCFESYNITDCQDGKYLYDVMQARDCQDLNYSLYHPECSYELISTLGMKYSAFNMASHYCHDTFYSDLCNNSNNLFGCIGLNRSEYCILNKQYSKEEYNKVKSEIIERMKAAKEYGEFFPIELSPFEYQISVANEYYNEQKHIIKEHQIKHENIRLEFPEKIDSVKELTKEIFLCESSNRPFRFIFQELEFYRKMGLPVPRKSPQIRHQERNILRNKRSLVKAACNICSSEIVTANQNKNLKIICESCYINSIYGNTNQEN